MSEVLNHKGKPLTFSWSAIESWFACPRAWYYGYMDRRRVEKESTRVGNAVHKAAEKYLKGEELFENTRWWKILTPGIEYAPTPEYGKGLPSGWGVETWLETPGAALPFVGKVDFHWSKPIALQAKVCDWKTTSDAWRWAKTPDQLAEFGQPLLYSYGLYREDPPQLLHFQHIYLLTRGEPQAMEVWAYDVPWRNAVKYWEDKALPISEAMAKCATTYDEAEAVPPNLRSCKNYGGCDHREYCPSSPMNRTRLIIPTPTARVPVAGNSKQTNARLAALRSQLGIKGGSSEATITPPVKTEEVPVTTTTKTTEEHPMAPHILTMLEDLGRVPHAVVVVMCGNDAQAAESLCTSLNLERSGDSWVRLSVEVEEVETPTVAYDFKPGMPLKEAMAICPPDKLQAELAKMGLRSGFGLILPADFDGPVTEAYRKFRPGTLEAKTAEAMEEVDPPTQPEPEPELEPEPEPETLPRPATPKPTPRKMAEEPVPSDDDQLNALAAGKLVEKLLTSGEPLAKAKAAEILKLYIPGVKRVRQNRWDAVLAASDGQLAFEKDRLILVEALPAGSGTLVWTMAEEPVSEEEPLVRTMAEEPPCGGCTETCACEPTCEETPEGVVERLPPEPTPPNPPLDVARQAAAARAVAVQEGRLPRGTPDSPQPCMVLVNCLPMGGPYITFDRWIAPFENEVAQANGVRHPFQLPYSDGAKGVVALVAGHLHQMGKAGLPTVMYVDTSHPMASAVLPVIYRLDPIVVKAVR